MIALSPVQHPISSVYEGDAMDFMATIGDKFFDLIIDDSPYGIGEDGRRSASRSGMVKQKNGSQMYVKAAAVPIKNWDNEMPSPEYFKELFRISKNQIIWGANHFGNMPPSSCWIVWDKCNIGTDQADAELAWTSFEGAVRLFPFMWSGMMQGSPGNGRRMQGNKRLNEKRIHPTQKPVSLYAWCLKKFATPGMKIGDMRMGSQSSRIAAYKLGFDYWGCEIDPDYFLSGNERFNKETDAPPDKLDEYIPQQLF